MSKLRAAIWALAIGVLSVVAAAMVSRLMPVGGVAFVPVLVVCVALLSGLLALLVELPPAVGAGGGTFGAVLVAVVL
ncbi:MAG: hypothetical protein ACXWLM_03065, partial [Myxococcales bacterium]